MNKSFGTNILSVTFVFTFNLLALCLKYFVSFRILWYDDTEGLYEEDTDIQMKMILSF